MSEPKSIEEVPSWVIVNALKCPVDSQISIVAKLLQHLDREQRDKALSMSGVSKRFYWLKPDGEISNMWNEETHKRCLTDKDVEDAQKDGWLLIQINVC
jgi:hypothetical protein